MPRERTILVAERIPAPNESYPHAPKIDEHILAEHAEFIAKCHALWQELHTKQDATPEWFADWVARVPSFGCGCQSWLAEYLVGHPPRYEDFCEWSVECHDAVNAKLGKPDWDHVAQST